jgi:putative transposase
MPVSSQHKRTTSLPEPSTSDPSTPVLPDQQAFHQYMRTLTQSAVRVVIETVMREELDQFIGAAWGECSPTRKGDRNGHYSPELVTATGRLQDIKVPRDRESQFHTQAFERYRRYEPPIAQGLDSDVRQRDEYPQSGGSGPKRCWEKLEVASTISRLNQSLTQQFESWRQRPLQEHWRILYLDGIHFSIRHGEQADSTIMLTADSGSTWKATKRCSRGSACAEEDKEGWVCLLQDLRRRGATQIDLIGTSGHDGLLAAVAELFSATPRQRCLVHKQRNVLHAIPRRQHGNVQVELVGIWEQPSKQEALIHLAASTRQVCPALSRSRAQPD